MIFAAETEDLTLHVFHDEETATAYCEGMDVEAARWLFWDDAGSPLAPEFSVPNQRRLFSTLSGEYHLVPAVEDHHAPLLEALEHMHGVVGEPPLHSVQAVRDHIARYRSVSPQHAHDAGQRIPAGLCDNFRLMAAYNAWMNTNLYRAAGKLPTRDLTADRGAFFRSIIGTLNHIVIADTIWLKRFSTHPSNYAALDPVRALPAPAALDELHSTDLEDLFRQRRMLDGVIVEWAAALSEDDLGHVLHYKYSRGVANRRFSSLIMHFFNHQTHHRGQASALMSQVGVDVGVTDLVAMIPDELV